MPHGHHHDHDDEPSAASMNAVVGFPLPGIPDLFAYLLRMVKTVGLSEALGPFGKAIAKFKLGTRQVAQAVADGAEVAGAAFHGLGCEFRISIVKVKNREPSA